MDKIIPRQIYYRIHFSFLNASLVKEMFWILLERVEFLESLINLVVEWKYNSKIYKHSWWKD